MYLESKLQQNVASFNVWALFLLYTMLTYLDGSLNTISCLYALLYIKGLSFIILLLHYYYGDCKNILLDCSLNALFLRELCLLN